MSILGEQINELREAARQFEGYQNGEITRMLREAADTIDSLRDRLQSTIETCRIEWRDESHDTDAGREYDGAYFCTKCMTDLPYQLQGCWDDYQALVADYGSVSPWDKKPFRCCPNCDRKVVDA